MVPTLAKSERKKYRNKERKTAKMILQNKDYGRYMEGGGYKGTEKNRERINKIRDILPPIPTPNRSCCLWFRGRSRVQFCVVKTVLAVRSDWVVISLGRIPRLPPPCSPDSGTCPLDRQRVHDLAAGSAVV